MSTGPLTDAAIDAMDAGTELDRLIAQHVFGYLWLEERPSMPGYEPDTGPISWQGWIEPETGNVIFDITWRDATTLDQPQFSLEIAPAWQVMEHLMRKYTIVVELYPEVWGKQSAKFAYRTGSPSWTGWADTMPLAICKAALKMAGYFATLAPTEPGVPPDDTK